MARTRPKAERRASLLDAAERLLVERGISRLTVEEVTTAAGVSKGTFYLYFSTKDDVIASLRERYATRVLQRQEAVVSRLAPADWAGRVETWVIAGVQDYLADPGLHDALFHHARRAGARPSIYADGKPATPSRGRSPRCPRSWRRGPARGRLRSPTRRPPRSCCSARRTTPPTTCTTRTTRR